MRPDFVFHAVNLNQLVVCKIKKNLIFAQKVQKKKKKILLRLEISVETNRIFFFTIIKLKS